MVDRYTKVVLTIIAASLAAIALQGAVRPAGAQLGQQHVVIDSVSSYAFQYAGPLAVRIQQ